jgi:Ni/Fe-hydrogenase 1 B-type cytochrome subunit
MSNSGATAVAEPVAKGPPQVVTPAPKDVRGEELVRVYVWDVVVRITHWAIALSIVSLSVTGIYIGWPFLIVAEGTGPFVMGWMKVIHFYSAIVFSLAVAARLWWMLVGPKYAKWWNFVPLDRERQKGFIGTLLFYGLIKRTPPPFVGHNPVAGAAYAAVYGLEVIMILTGFALYSMSADVGSYMRFWDFLLPLFGGAQITRWIHHVVMWLLLGFVIQHVYSGILVAHVEKNGTMDSIISGYKWFKRKDVR